MEVDEIDQIKIGNLGVVETAFVLRSKRVEDCWNFANELEELR